MAIQDLPPLRTKDVIAERMREYADLADRARCIRAYCDAALKALRREEPDVLKATFLLERIAHAART